MDTINYNFYSYEFNRRFSITIKIDYMECLEDFIHYRYNVKYSDMNEFLDTLDELENYTVDTLASKFSITKTAAEDFISLENRNNWEDFYKDDIKEYIRDVYYDDAFDEFKEIEADYKYI